MYKHSSCANTERQTHTCFHIHTKPPSGQGLTLTLKGLCLAPVIAIPQAGYVVSISTSMCLWAQVCVKPQYIEWTLADTPGTQGWLSHGFVCACIIVVCFFCEQLRNNSIQPTMLREAEQLCFWRRLFVVVEREEMRSCWGLWLGASRVYRRAGPGREENTNHLLTGLAVLMEMRNSSFSAMYQSKVECVVTPSRAISLLLSVSSHFTPPLAGFQLSLHVTMYYCETVHAREMTNHSSQRNSSFSSYLRYLPPHFTLTYSIWRLRRGHRVEHCSWLPKNPLFHPHLLFFVSIHCFWKLSRLPFSLCLSTQDLALPLLHICHPSIVHRSLTAQINVSLQLHKTSLATSRLPTSHSSHSSLGKSVPSFN